MVRACSHTKQLATGRESLSLISVLGQKTCKKYEANITKYKVVINAGEKILEECMDSAAKEK